MSILNDFAFIELQDFGGAWLFSDPSVVHRQGALLARNVDFSQGEVGTRRGFGPIGLAMFDIQATEMYSWIGPFNAETTAGLYTDQLLIWFAPSSFHSTALGSPAVFLGNPVTGDVSELDFERVFSGGSLRAGATFVGAGMRLFITYHTETQSSTPAHDATYGVVITLDKIGVGSLTQLRHSRQLMFDGPWTKAMYYTEPAAGVVTDGVHLAGYLIEWASGFTTRVSPDNGLPQGTGRPPSEGPPDLTSFVPLSVVATGGKNLHFTFEGLPGEDCKAVSIVMTTRDNHFQYYIVPGSRTIWTSSLATTGITVDISDDDLAATGTDATPYLYWLTSGPDHGAGPFKPTFHCLWGDRMAYKAYILDNQQNQLDAVYVSERNNYQAITVDQHVIQLPGARTITTMFRMGTVNYLCSHHEIWSVMDNGDVPVTWATPHLVDGRFGTPAIHGVDVSPSGNYAWIADEQGFYLFTGGPITDLAISYEQTPDWNRINWDAAYRLKIRDDAASKRVYVMVPLDGATVPTHIMMWEYTAGITFDRVRYSLQSLNDYPLGAMELVRNDMPHTVTGNRRQIELWLGAQTDIPMLRRLSLFDPEPYLDNGATIEDLYRTTPFPGRDSGQSLIHMHHGFKARLTGNGTVTPVLRDIDAVRSFICRTVTLVDRPNQDDLFLADLNAENAYVEFSTKAPGTYWNLAYMCWYYSPWLMQR